jgi:hypothetical protein
MFRARDGRRGEFLMLSVGVRLFDCFKVQAHPPHDAHARARNRA